MKPKPAGAKYRNLYAYRDSIWFERVVRGRRARVDLETASWEEASARRDAYEVAKGIGQRRPYAVRAPTFAEFAARYLEEDAFHLAATTRVDRRRHLGPAGPLVTYFGRKLLDEITPGRLREWWGE